MYLYLLHETDLFEKPRKLLHVAPEPRLGETLRTTPTIDYLSADISSQSVMARMDITDIRIPDGTFDAIICNHVLEHVVEDGKAMAELYRALKPGGWAVLQVPISLSLARTYEDRSITTRAGREEAFGQRDHVRIYARDYQDRLKRAGFKVSVFTWVAKARLFGGRRNLFGLNVDESVYFVARPR